MNRYNSADCLILLKFGRLVRYWFTKLDSKSW